MSEPIVDAGGQTRRADGENPALVPHLQYRLQLIRGQAWAIIRNTVSGQYLRLDAALWQALQELDGRLPMGQWLSRHEQQFDRVSLLEALAQLQRHGLVSQGDRPVPVARTGFNPLMVRLPLCNPSRWLARVSRMSDPVPGRWLLIMLVLLYLGGAVLAVLNSEALMQGWQSMLASPDQWWRYLLLYPFMKLLHELSHALVLMRLGGQVREAGISLLVLMPVPYVDATESWSLPRRRDRLAVTAAGILCDMLLAVLALILWLVVSDGMVSDMAFAILVMASGSVLLFNGNPLLKFDSYYLLEDVLDSPGLMRRSAAWWLYLGKRYLLGMAAAARPVVARGERRWLLGFGLASQSYRLVISVTIALFLMSRFHELGLLLAAFTIMPAFIRPVYRLVQWLFASTQLQGRRWQTTARLLGVASLILLPALLLPLPSSTRAEGVLWSAEQSEIFAAEAGEIIAIAVEDGQQVDAGDVLLQLHAPALQLELERLVARIAILEVERTAARSTDPLAARTLGIEIDSARQSMQRLRSRLQMLTVTAARDGRIALATPTPIPGQSVLQGQLLMYLVDDRPLVVRAVIDQRQLGRLQVGVSEARIRVAGDIRHSRSASVQRELPAGTRSLPSLALADAGFGGIDVRQEQGELRTLEEVFHLELTPDQPIPAHRYGGLGARAHVSLTHPPEPLATRWWRDARRLFIKHLGA